MATKLVRNLSNGKVQEIPASRAVPVGYELVAVAPCMTCGGGKVLTTDNKIKTRADFGLKAPATVMAVKVAEEKAPEPEPSFSGFHSKFSPDSLGKEDDE